MADNVEMMTLDEIAENLKVSKRTAWRYYKSGDLKGIKLDGVIRIPKENYNNFIKERTN